MRGHDSDYDFSYGSVNLNLVYRWQYRPGSTLYMVWTHSRGSYDQRDFHEQRQVLRTLISWLPWLIRDSSPSEL